MGFGRVTKNTRDHCSGVNPPPRRNFHNQAAKTEDLFFFFDDDDAGRFKTHGDATVLHAPIPLKAPTLSAGNPFPLRGTKGLRHLNPSRCDAPRVVKQTTLLPHKTASRRT